MCGAISYLTPYYGDDLFYLLPFRTPDSQDAFSAQFPGISAYLKYVHVHYLEFNARLADKVLVLILLLPKWVSALITAAAVFILLNAPCFILKRAYSSTTRIVVATLLIFLLPWYNRIFMTAFTVNYIWGSALALPCWAYLSGVRKPANKVQSIGATLLIVIGGLWHEGFTITILAGIVVYAVCRYKEFTRMQWILVAIWIVCTFCVTSSPASWERFEQEVTSGLSDRIFDLRMLCCFNLSLLYLPLLAFILISKKQCTMSARDRAVIYAAGSMLAINLLLFTVTSFDYRMSFFSMPFVLAVIPLFFSRGILAAVRIRRLDIVIQTGCVVLLVVHLGLTLYWQTRLYAETRELVTVISNAPRGVEIEISVMSESDVSPLTLGKTSAGVLRSGYTLDLLARYFDTGKIEVR